jgi:hypothetical protein
VPESEVKLSYITADVQDPTAVAADLSSDTFFAPKAFSKSVSYTAAAAY